MTDGDRPVLGYVVDIQRDFMNPDGRLYVANPEDDSDPGAEACRSEIVRSVEYMRDNTVGPIFSGDWHGYEDDEIDTEDPDFVNTYPPHCMGRADDPDMQSGAFLIEEVGFPFYILRMDDDEQSVRRIASSLVSLDKEVFVQKKRFNVFEGNPMMDLFVESVSDEFGQRPEVLICGVSRDVCVDQAVQGFLERDFPVTVIEDAMWGLGLEMPEESFSKWETQGAELTTVDELGSDDD